MGSERKPGGRPGPPVTWGRVAGTLLTAAAVLLIAGCADGGRPPAASPAPLPPDPRTQAALLRIATGYWFYVRHRWVFDLVLSNPDAVWLYRMSPQRYAAAVGCAGESG
jgi:hypothetical protein